MSDVDAVDALAATVLERFGRVDIVVNNAGAARGDDRVPVIDLDPMLWRKVIDVNLTGTFLMSAEFGRRMIEAGQRRLDRQHLLDRRQAVQPEHVGLRRVEGRHPGVDGVHGPGDRRATACGSTPVCPGIIDTSRMDDLGRGEAWEQIVKTMIPLGRAGTGDDIAATVVYLCSDQGSWVTGQSWNVDGGTVVQH